jgi:hypothetical protein
MASLVVIIRLIGGVLRRVGRDLRLTSLTCDGALKVDESPHDWGRSCFHKTTMLRSQCDVQHSDACLFAIYSVCNR